MSAWWAAAVVGELNKQTLARMEPIPHSVRSLPQRAPEGLTLPERLVPVVLARMATSISLEAEDKADQLTRLLLQELLEVREGRVPSAEPVLEDRARPPAETQPPTQVAVAAAAAVRLARNRLGQAVALEVT